MFDVDGFIADCLDAVREPQPHLAIRDVLQRALQHPEAIARALPADRGELTPLYADDDLSIIKVVWWPGMRVPPHDHLMWAAIGLYGGQEDNYFYRRERGTITAAGGRELRTGDVALLGDDVVHAVVNPRHEVAGAIHVYGGDLTTRAGRREWDDAGREQPVHFGRTQELFASFAPC
jgi:predicted metal-dependent enzyme (double-stranded beta helix superfamily)